MFPTSVRRLSAVIDVRTDKDPWTTFFLLLHSTAKTARALYDSKRQTGLRENLQEPHELPHRPATDYKAVARLSGEGLQGHSYGVGRSK